MLKKFVLLNFAACEWLNKTFPRFFYFSYEDGHREFLRNLVSQICAQVNPERIMDVGAATRPLLPKGGNYHLTGLDIEDLEGCEELYDEFLVQSIEDPIPGQKQDMIYSNAVLEHVPNNKAALASIYDCLAPGGTTCHYVPGKNHPYALILRAIGPKYQKQIIRMLRPRTAEGVTGYPTFFDYCSPRQMRKLLEQTGFENIKIEPSYRANSYFKFFVPLYMLVTLFENCCELFNWTTFCSGMMITARKARH